MYCAPATEFAGHVGISTPKRAVIGLILEPDGLSDGIFAVHILGVWGHKRLPRLGQGDGGLHCESEELNVGDLACQ
jgi:hypothetical protein